MDEEILCESLEQLFRLRVPQRRFKVGRIHSPNLMQIPYTLTIARSNGPICVIATGRRRQSAAVSTL